jgi:hypothetical protein
VVLRAPKSFINNTLWPEFLQIKDALDEYLNEATERIIRDEVFGNAEEAEEQAASTGALAALPARFQGAGQSE